MYYSNGNYEAFARPRKPEGVDDKHAWIVGTGLAGLAAATFLIRDAQMPGANIHLIEELPLAGGSLDGEERPDIGFITRGGREMKNHFECLWDMYRSIPSLEIPGASYLDEYYWLDKDDPNSSNCRLIHDRGNRVPTDGDFTLTENAQLEIVKLVTASEHTLEGRTIEDYFSEEFFASNFWFYWATMFAFEKWHSLIEMRRYVMRFIHHTGGLPDFTALKFNRYNQYDSMVRPILAYLLDHGVDVRYGTTVTDIDVTIDGAGDSEKKMATALHLATAEGGQTVELGAEDYVFVTNGSITESTTYGSHHTAAPVTTEPGGAWELWENLASKSPDFGRPAVFYKNLPEKSWYVSATATVKDARVEPFIERLTRRSLHDGKVNTGGIITVTDSTWLMSFAVHRQPHFTSQNPDETVVWIYALYSDVDGDYVKKPIVECTGEEITQEWLYHLGVPVDQIDELASQTSINTNPVYMPFITAYFMPRRAGDRPAVVPQGSANLAFIGNFAESPSRDTVFTTEYSVRTAMEAVYTFMNVDRGIPEVFGSVYDLRELLKATYHLRDRKSFDEQPVTTKFKLPVPGFVKAKVRAKLDGVLHGTWIEELLQDSGLLKR
ncbi:MAG: oleate hydratase [Corynebacterium sp.]|uniref:oleate hydratase n=1 Tax=Corynebacterium sp. TaxID=1720 RepID=UPI002648C92D|nr:oleate hydratase [Corynebacterium sp.]MDN5720851.1 oleate hydratase [Corynebacterium sp.]MDN6386839.1 oleate hydratase [Corynebacterium sp.]